tara:strand:+ start:538 stop:1065 length:528 start_codon:yes stop_codon:yes gene_type:complete
VHIVERKQESLSNNFTQSVFDDVAKQDSNIEEITLQVKPKPIVQDDESFTSLAERIVDEVVANRSPKSLAKQVLEQAGITNDNQVAEPKIFNGHLRHVGRRARKISRKQNQSQELRIRRVKRTSRGPPPNLRRMGAPISTRERPSIGMEDEVRRSGRDVNNKRGKTKKKRRLFRR